MDCTTLEFGSIRVIPDPEPVLFDFERLASMNMTENEGKMRRFRNRSCITDHHAVIVRVIFVQIAS